MKIMNNLCKSLFAFFRQFIVIASLTSIAFAASEADPVTSGAKIVDNERLDRILEDDIVLGNKDSKIVIIEYFAPTCSYCADYHKNIFPSIKSKYIDTSKVAYVIREVVSNKQDLDASLIARCDSGLDLGLRDKILSRQEVWAYSSDYRNNLIELIGGDYPDLKERADVCFDNKDNVSKLFKQSMLAFRNENFIGTPSFLINGSFFKGDLEDMSNFIGNLVNNVGDVNELSS